MPGAFENQYAPIPVQWRHVHDAGRLDTNRVVQPRAVAVARLRPQQCVDFRWFTAVGKTQLRQIDVAAPPFRVLGCAWANREYLGQLVVEKRHGDYEAPLSLGWLTNFSPPLIVTLPSSARGVSCPFTICSRSSARGT